MRDRGTGVGRSAGKGRYGSGTGQSAHQGQSGDGRANIFPTVGYVLEYRELYRRGVGSQAVGGMYNPFWVISYTQCPELRTGVCAAGNVAIERGTWCISREEGHQEDLNDGVQRVLSRGVQGANPEYRRRHRVILQGKALQLGGALTQQPKRCQISAGIGRAEVVCHGVISGPI